MKVELLWEHFAKFIIDRLFRIDSYNHWNAGIKKYLSYLLTETCTDKRNLNLWVRWHYLLELILEELQLKTFIAGLKHKIELLLVIRNIILIICCAVAADMNDLWVLAHYLLKFLDSDNLLYNLEFLLRLLQVSNDLLILNLQIERCVNRYNLLPLISSYNWVSI